MRLPVCASGAADSKRGGVRVGHTVVASEGIETILQELR
jgi:hypothetical protein